SASFAAGGIAASGSIGVAFARNLIGFTHDPLATWNFVSSQTGVSLANGDQVKVTSGARQGDIYKYIGTARANVDLSQEDYTDSALWMLVGLTTAAEQVQAYVHNSAVTATGALNLT